MPTVSPGYTFTGTNDPITYTKLNLLGQPTVAAVGPNDVTTSTIANLAVTTAKLADDAVTTAKIADDAVTTDQIASGNTYDTVTITNGTTVSTGGVTVTAGGITLGAGTPINMAATTETPYSGAMSLTFSATKGNTRLITATGSTASTITPATIPAAGYVLIIRFNAGSTGGNVITFGSGFKTLTATPTLTLATANKYYSIMFVSDGTDLVEISRTASVG
jgi:hypothetical protein